MRRPVKPFVTEYKGSTRRPKEASEADQTFNIEAFPARSNGGRHDPDLDTGPGDASAGDPRARPTESRTRSKASQRSDAGRLNAANGEDSYEAALRAADALFSPASPSQNGHQAKPDRSAAAPVSPEPDAGETSKAPPSGSGRILRSLDEPPPPSFADREEALPKRRGRKPGSKNKPKIPSPDHGAGREHRAASFEAAEWTRSPAPAASARFAPAHAPSARLLPARPSAGRAGGRADISATSRFAQAVPVAGGVPTIGRLAAVRQQGQRFSWVRTTLTPGQRWKRRLPKVIW